MGGSKCATGLLALLFLLQVSQISSKNATITSKSTTTKSTTTTSTTTKAPKPTPLPTTVSSNTTESNGTEIESSKKDKRQAQRGYTDIPPDERGFGDLSNTSPSSLQNYESDLRENLNDLRNSLPEYLRQSSDALSSRSLDLGDRDPKNSFFAAEKRILDLNPRIGDNSAAAATTIEERRDDGEDEGKPIPGEAGRDYPVFSKIPKTPFSCKDHQWPGYYADVGARCQVFWICQKNRMDAFLCPNGTLFNQQVFVCDWWFNVDCSASPEFYSRNQYLYAGRGVGIDGKPTRFASGGGSGTSNVFFQRPSPQLSNVNSNALVNQVQSSNQIARVATATGSQLQSPTQQPVRVSTVSSFFNLNSNNQNQQQNQQKFTSNQNQLLNRMQKNPTNRPESTSGNQFIGGYQSNQISLNSQSELDKRNYATDTKIKVSESASDGSRSSSFNLNSVSSTRRPDPFPSSGRPISSSTPRINVNINTSKSNKLTLSSLSIGKGGSVSSTSSPFVKVNTDAPSFGEGSSTLKTANDIVRKFTQSSAQLIGSAQNVYNNTVTSVNRPTTREPNTATLRNPTSNPDFRTQPQLQGSARPNQINSEYGTPFKSSPTPNPNYGTPTPNPNYGTPTPNPNYGTPTPNPNYGTPTPNPNYGTPTPNPNYGTPTPNPNYGTPTPNPNYGTPTPNPNYGTPTPNPNYGTPTPRPNYGTLINQPGPTGNPNGNYGPPGYNPPPPETTTQASSEYGAPGHTPGTPTSSFDFVPSQNQNGGFVSTTTQPNSYNGLHRNYFSTNYGQRSNQFSNVNGQREVMYSSRSNAYAEYPYSPSQQKNKQRLLELQSAKGLSASAKDIFSYPHFHGQRSNAFSDGDSISYISNNNKKVTINHAQRQAPFTNNINHQQIHSIQQNNPIQHHTQLSPTVHPNPPLQQQSHNSQERLIHPAANQIHSHNTNQIHHDNHQHVHNNHNQPQPGPNHHSKQQLQQRGPQVPANYRENTLNQPFSTQQQFNPQQPPPQQQFNPHQPPPQQQFNSQPPPPQQQFNSQQPPPQQQFNPQQPPPQQQFNFIQSQPTPQPQFTQQQPQPQQSLLQSRFHSTPSPHPFHERIVHRPSTNLELPSSASQQSNLKVSPDGYTTLNTNSFISIQTTGSPFSKQLLKNIPFNQQQKGGFKEGNPSSFIATTAQPFSFQSPTPNSIHHNGNNLGSSPAPQQYHQLVSLSTTLRPPSIHSTAAPFSNFGSTFPSPSLALPTAYSTPNNFIQAPTQIPYSSTSPGHRTNPYLPHNHGKRHKHNNQHIHGLSPPTANPGQNANSNYNNDNVISTTIRYPEGTGSLKVLVPNSGSNKRNIVDFSYSANPPISLSPSGTTPYPSVTERFNNFVSSSTTARPNSISSSQQPYREYNKRVGSNTRLAGAVVNKSTSSSNAIYVDASDTAESVSTPVSVSPSVTPSSVSSIPVSTSNFGLRISSTAKKRMAGAWQNYFSGKEKEPQA